MVRTNVVLAAAAMLLASSCGTYTGQGAYAGATFGTILGSAIGGISDGPRGHDVGTIVGMAGGAVIGGMIGNAQDQQRQRCTDEVYSRREPRRHQSDRRVPVQPGNEEDYGSGFDKTNSGDDRLYDFESGMAAGSGNESQPRQILPGSSSVENIASGIVYTPTIEIRNARFVDADGDNVIRRGEMCRVVFEVYNHSRKTIYDIQPMVVEATGNRHLYISPGIHVEKIAPGKGIRYTALVKADNRIKKGTARICISVIEGNNRKISEVNEFHISTDK